MKSICFSLSAFRLLPSDFSSSRITRHCSYALKAEAVHAKLYQMALEALQQGNDLTEVDFYLCPVCGNIEIGKAPDACPICGAKGERFIKM